MKVKEHDGALTFDVLVQPRASRAKIGPIHDDRGLSIVRARSEARSGSRCKTVRVAGTTRAAIEALAG